MFRVRSIAAAHPHVRRSLSLAAAGVLAVALTSCTGRGGGQLPAKLLFSGPASFGFSFSCEDSGGLNPPPGRLRIQLSYTDHGSNPLGSPFSIHGIVDDDIDPVLESMLCAGQEPPLDGNELIFLGRYWLTSSAPALFPSTCAGRETDTTPLCRFEVKVRDNDVDRGPSKGDFFKIILSNRTMLESELDPGLAPYVRAGVLSSGNITVD